MHILPIHKIYFLKDTGVTVEDILTFFTDAKEIPPMGFDQTLKMEFIHGQRLLNTQPALLLCSYLMK